MLTRRSREVPYVERELSEIPLPWLARVRLRRIRRQRRTGLLLHGVIGTSSRSLSAYAPLVVVLEGREVLCACSKTSKLPKWVPRQPGTHEFEFRARNGRSHSTFSRSFELSDGDILVAICRPIQDKWWFQQRPVLLRPGTMAHFGPDVTCDA